jgi:hypothetical protein
MVQRDRIPVHFLLRSHSGLGVEREIVVHIRLVGQCLLVQLIAFFAVALKDDAPVPLEGQGAADLTRYSDSNVL